MNIAESLESLGLTQIEALAYTFLVANRSSTGYRVARGIGKPTANVYRALESLGRKGAVMQDKGATPSFRALSPDELLARLEAQFVERKTSAARALASLQPDEGDERLYSLKSREQVLSRARIQLVSARKVVLIDTDARLLAMIPAEISDARGRGVRVLVRSRAQSGDDSSGNPDHRDTLVDSPPPAGTYPSLRIATDAREMLTAWFSWEGDRVLEAAWTRSRFLSRSAHEALAAERCCLLIEQRMADGLSVDEVESVFEEWRALHSMV
jgi:sugar-specific transcriptional regulator TrmB